MSARTHLVILTAIVCAACGSPSDPSSQAGGGDAAPTPPATAPEQRSSVAFEASRLCEVFSEAELRSMLDIPDGQPLESESSTTDADLHECRYRWTIADPAEYFAERERRDMERMREATQALVESAGDRAAMEAAIRGGVEAEVDDHGPHRTLNLSFMPRENRYGISLTYDLALGSVEYNRTDHDSLEIAGHQGLLARNPGGYQVMVFRPDGMFSVHLHQALSGADGERTGIYMAQRLAEDL